MSNAGQGCALNGRQAAQFFLRAAVRGHTMAMRNLAHILAEGRASSAAPGQIESDDDQDEDEALNSRDPVPTRLSRRLSHLLDTNHSAFQTGQVSRNINMALHWFDKAAAAGDHEGVVDAEKLMRNEVSVDSFVTFVFVCVCSPDRLFTACSFLDWCSCINEAQFVLGIIRFLVNVVSDCCLNLRNLLFSFLNVLLPLVTFPRFSD
jgi:TPR repeat protein